MRSKVSDDDVQTDTSPIADAANRRGVSGTNATALMEQRFLPSPTPSNLVHGEAEPLSQPLK